MLILNVLYPANVAGVPTVGHESTDQGQERDHRFL